MNDFLILLFGLLTMIGIISGLWVYMSKIDNNTTTKPIKQPTKPLQVYTKQDLKRGLDVSYKGRNYKVISWESNSVGYNRVLKTWVTLGYLTPTYSNYDSNYVVICGAFLEELEHPIKS